MSTPTTTIFTIPSSASHPHRYTQARAIWITAVVLPVFALLSGLLIGFLCWRRWSSAFSNGDGRKKALDSKGGFEGGGGEGEPRLPLKPLLLNRIKPAIPTTRFQPLFSNKQETSTNSRYLRPFLVSSNSKSNFSTKLDHHKEGSPRVLVRKSIQKKPIVVSWPISIPLETIQDEGGNGLEEETKKKETIDEINVVHEDQPQQVLDTFDPREEEDNLKKRFELLVQESKNTRTSWDFDEDESTRGRLVRSRSLGSLSSSSSRSYNPSTVGMTTLGDLIDREIGRLRVRNEDDDEDDSTTTPPSSPSSRYDHDQELSDRKDLAGHLVGEISASQFCSSKSSTSFQQPIESLSHHHLNIDPHILPLSSTPHSNLVNYREPLAQELQQRPPSSSADLYSLLPLDLDTYKMTVVPSRLSRGEGSSQGGGRQGSKKSDEMQEKGIGMIEIEGGLDEQKWWEEVDLVDWRRNGNEQRQKETRQVFERIERL